ncbi:MAG TPA: hypothetical protein VFQ45_01135 [Longimicrobium sp.]|nr:hypothetical protein [Longimicrobium sp.]
MSVRVVFAGMDGSGKSTQAAEVERRLREMGYRVVRAHQYTPSGALGRGVSRLGAVLARRAAGSGEEMSEAEASASPTSVAKAPRGAKRWAAGGVALASLCLGWLRAWRAEWRGRGADVLLLDRSFVDELIRVRWRLQTVPRLGYRLLALLPPPDRAFRLTLDPATGVLRKKGRSLTEAEYRAKLQAVEGVLATLPPRWRFEDVPVDGRDVDAVAEGLLRSITAKAGR